MNPKQVAVSISTPELESRRQFLKVSVLTLAALGMSSVGFADPDGDNENDDDKNRNSNKAVGKGVLDLGLASSFQLGKVSDQTAQAGVMISRTKQGLIALAAVCTHQGCSTKHSNAADLFICPCHGARFSNDGAVTQGPARTPLSRYPISIKNGRVLVDTNTLIRRSSVRVSDFVKV